MNLQDRPLFTQTLSSPLDFCPESGSVYIFGVTDEERSEFALQLQERAKGVAFIELREAQKFTIEVDNDGETSIIQMRRRAAVENFVRSIGNKQIYIDITGLQHSTWAPIVRVCVEINASIRAVYLEPSEYTRNVAPRFGDFYDLSEKIQGIEPLPLYATLHDRNETDVCFVPLLGFEGARFAHMLEEIQPPLERTYPIIGVPGFRAEYPFSAFLGNSAPLERSKSFHRLRFTRSNCPFSAYYVIEDIAERNKDRVLKLGLVGTKPHSLGAVLYAIMNPSTTEIIYDHVKRKKNRTTGSDNCLVYGISEFLNITAGR
jgi:hypothetical protein